MIMLVVCPCSASFGNEQDSSYADFDEASSCDSFDQMGLHKELLRGISSYGEHSWWFSPVIRSPEVLQTRSVSIPDTRFTLQN